MPEKFHHSNSRRRRNECVHTKLSRKPLELWAHQLDETLHVVDADIPILLSIADMDKYKIVSVNAVDNLVQQPSGLAAKVIRRFGTGLRNACIP